MPSDVLFTQGGTIYNSKLYYTFGCPQSDYPLRILAFDLQRKTLCAQVENLTEAFRGEEIECCDIYKDRLICNTCNGNLFLLEEGIIELT